MKNTVVPSVYEVQTLAAKVDSVFVPSEYFVSTSTQKRAEIALDSCLCFIVSLVGIVNNIFVIKVFAKMGFKDTVNISMTFIAFWDLVKCLAGAMQRMSGPVQLINKADAAGWANIGVVAFNYLICFTSYVSSVLAAFVAIERCLCVSMPFKVKDIITPKVTFIVCLLISVGIFGAFVVMWSVYDIVWMYHPAYNRSIYVYRYSDIFYKHQGPLFEYYNISGIVWPIISLAITSVCTGIIAHYLRKSSSFRTSGLSDASSKGEPKVSRRDRQVVKMLLVIIIVYIISLLPRVLLYLAKYFVYELYWLRLYHNLFMIVGYVLFFFDLFNSAVNLYIFLFMSTSFRSTFLSLFSFYSKKTQA